MSTNESTIAVRADQRDVARLTAAVHAMAAVDLSVWSDSSLQRHLTDLSVVLCEVDAQLARVADAIRARGYRIVEPGSASSPGRSGMLVGIDAQAVG